MIVTLGHVYQLLQSVLNNCASSQSVWQSCCLHAASQVFSVMSVFWSNCYHSMFLLSDARRLKRSWTFLKVFSRELSRPASRRRRTSKR